MFHVEHWEVKMLNDLINKKVQVYIGSNSGAGVSNGSHGERTSISSTIIVSGTVVDFNEKFIYLNDVKTQMLDQLDQTVFGRGDKLANIESNNTIISLDKVLFINY